MRGAHARPYNVIVSSCRRVIVVVIGESLRVLRAENVYHELP